MEKSQLRKLLFAVALVFASLVTFGGVQQKIYFDIAGSHAIASRQNALVKIRASCAVEKSPDMCRTAALRAARAEQREEYDLYSQRTMASWTAIMGIMAITGAALSAIGIYLVWRTWDATREAAESSRKTLRSYIARERAVILIDRAMSVLEDDRVYPNGFKLKLRNGGLSIAKLRSIEWEVSLTPIFPEKLRMQTWINMIVLPGAEQFSPFLEWDQPERGREKSYLLGNVHYSTLENEIYTSSFAYELSYCPPFEYDPEYWLAGDCAVAEKPLDT